MHLILVILIVSARRGNSVNLYQLSGKALNEVPMHKYCHSSAVSVRLCFLYVRIKNF
jgi:hypothetical protein